MTTLWTSEEAVAATNGSAAGHWTAARVSMDSRTTHPGDLFVAVKGPHFDGHEYVADALTKGAVAAMVQTAPEHIPPEKLLIVDNVQTALEQLAMAARGRAQAKIIAVTGSAGKTTTKEMLAQVFGVFGKTVQTEGGFNNHIGVPYSLSNLPVDAAYGVYELGMNHAGEIAALTRIVRPDIALVTTIAPAHVEHFKDGIDGIARAKAEIFESMAKAGTAILPRDVAQYPILQEAALKNTGTVLTFGHHESADARLINFGATPAGSASKIEVAGVSYDLMLSVAGEHMVLNALGVLLAVQAAGEDIKTALQTLEKFQALPGRGLQKTVTLPGGGAFTLLDESYNANPASVQAALDVLQATSGRKLVVLGDMLELGPDEIEIHTNLAKNLEAAGVSLVFTCGVLTEYLYTALPEGKRGGHARTAQEIADIVVKSVQNGDTILVKASRGTYGPKGHMAVVVEALEALSGERHKHAL